MNSLEKTIRESLLNLKRDGTSINAMAKKAGVQQSSLSKFVRGKGTLSLSTLEKLWPFLCESQRQASGE